MTVSAETGRPARPPSPPGTSLTGRSARGAEGWPALATRFGPVTVLTVGLLLAFTMWLRLNRRLWFFGDDWEFLLHRGTVPGADRGLLTPHNEHWSTIPILVYRALFAVFGLDHYLPYVVPMLLAHLGVCTLLYVLLRRSGLNPWVAVGCGLFMAFLGSGAENTTWAFQVGFVGSVFFGFLAVLLYDRYDRDGWRIWFVWAAAILGLMCSGIGIPMVVMVTAFAVVRRGWRSGLAVAWLPTLVYLVWYAGWGRTGTRSSATWPEDFLLVPDYVWTGLTTTWERNTGIPASGAVVVFLILGAAALCGSRPARGVALAGLSAALALEVLSGVSRIGFGVSQATASRYAYLLTALMLPAVGVLADWAWRRSGWPRWLVAVIAIGIGGLFLVNGVKQAYQFTVGRVALVGDLPAQVGAALEIGRSGTKLLTEQPSPTFNPDITVSGLRAVADRVPPVEVSAAARLAAAGELLVGVGPTDPGLGAVSSPVLSGFAPATAGPGCQTYQAGAGKEGIAFAVPSAGAQLQVTGTQTQIETRLVSGGSVGPWRVSTVPAGDAAFVGSTAAGDTLEVSLDTAGPTTICTS